VHFFALSQENTHEKHITIHVGNFSYSMTTSREFVGEVLRDEHIDLYPEDTISPPMTAVIQDNARITVDPATPVSIVNFVGETHPYRTHARTVKALLQEIGFTPQDDERVVPDPDTPIMADMSIRMITYLTEEYTEQTAIAYETEYITDSSLAMPQRIVEQEGSEGMQENVYQFIYENDELVDTIVVSSMTTREPVQEIIRVGTKLPDTGIEIERGIASYYGDGFNGKLTASGMTFNNTELYAAHRTLPFGTLLKVTNQGNGQSIIVKVVDRGPYVDGRVIDLSKTAFESIAPLSSGITNVTLEVAS
jgi:rare lipoprotein A